MDYFKEITGKTKEEAFRIPTSEESLARTRQKVMSKQPLRDIGFSGDGYLSIAEENRASHIHILGTTREGKSKFLEMLLTQDMGNFGATLLDPSDNGQRSEEHTSELQSP